MKDRIIDRFVVLPFTLGCVTQSSIDVVINNQTKSGRVEAITAPPTGDGESSTQSTKLKSSSSFPNISAGFHKLLKGLKSLSQMFILYDDDTDDDDGDIEMHVGFPTDVQHVGHIGWDGNSFNNMKSFDHQQQLLSLPSFSLMKHFELAMAASQAGAQAHVHGPLQL